MKTIISSGVLFLVLFGCSWLSGYTQSPDISEEYKFKTIVNQPATPVKNQYLTSTCWSFSLLSMLESELIRQNIGEYDLSEMFIVRHVYKEKAIKYVRMHGSVNFGGGGIFHDALNVISTYGIVPDEVYSGLLNNEKNHVHSEMDKVLKSYMDNIIQNHNKKLSPFWYTGFSALLDSYLGEIPDRFQYNGKTYDPKSFALKIGLNPENYIQLSSFTHHTFYEKFILEVPDNWAWGSVYNIPLDELMEIIYHAIEKGYTVSWEADISEKGFSWQNGIAVVPDIALKNLKGIEKEKWESLTEKERENRMFSFSGPVPEKTITQELRQEGFNNYETTDDHGMHITGLATDQLGNKYFLVKNSWGLAGNPYNGYLYVSDPYIRYKTIVIAVNKNSIPERILEKLFPE